MSRSFPALLLSAVVVACDQGGFQGVVDNVPYFCDTTGGADESYDFGCIDCEIDNPTFAADYDVRSYATIRELTALETTGASLTSYAPFAFFDPWQPGSHVGVFLRLPDNLGGILPSLAIRVRTYFFGFLIESAQSGATVGLDERELVREDLPESAGPEFPRSFYYFTTTQAFDSFEVSISSTGLHDGGATETKIYGLCSNGGLN